MNLQTGAVRIKTNPTSAEVYVNNVYKGVSPQDISGLNPGEVRIRVQKDGYKTVYQNTRITSGEISILSIILDPEITTGSLLVQPEDARIRILNIRERFYQGIDLAAGKYHVEVSKEGYETHSEWVQIIAGITNKFKIDLKKKSQLTETFTNRLGMTFVLIKAGRFMMGSPTSEPDREDNETQHEVVLTKDYYMQTTEVTQGQWKAVMGNNPSLYKECGDNCPVDWVSWNDVQKFIQKLNQKGEAAYRLPTEAEWEYAARAGTTTAYSFGNDSNQLSKYGNFCDFNCTYSPKDTNQNDQYENTAPVKSYPPNAWGLYDMHGNVREWCSDWYGVYPTNRVIDPQGAQSDDFRLLRGGSWIISAGKCRSAFRFRNTPRERYTYVGVRLAASLSSASSK